MDDHLRIALNDIDAAICAADYMVEDLKSKTRCNSSFFDTLIGYENRIKKAQVSYGVVRKELDKRLC